MFRSNALTVEKAQKRLTDLGSEHIVVKKIYGTKDAFQIMCNLCNATYEKCYRHIKTKPKCLECKGNIEKRIVITKEMVQDAFVALGLKDQVIEKIPHSHGTWKIKCGVEKCGKEYSKTYRDIQNKSTCIYCAINTGKCHSISIAETGELVMRCAEVTIESIRELVGDSGEVITQVYVPEEPINIKCKGCGQIYERTYGALKISKRCKHCAKEKKRKDMEEHVRKVIHDNGEELCSEYRSSHDNNLKIKCTYEHMYEMSWHDYQSGHGCTICAGNAKLILDDIKEIALKDGYTILDTKYVNNKTKLLFMCPSGHLFEMCWSSFQQEHRCSVCAGNQRLELDKLKEIALQDGYTILDTEYISNKTKLKFLCPSKHVFYMRWNDFQQKRRCFICRMSKGERKIYDYLTDLKIKFECQWTFDDCLSPLHNKLKFDFFIYPNLCCEYNGDFHYIIKFQDEKELEKIQLYDNIKKEYCEKNNIRLLVIHYSNFKHIENILLNELSQYFIDILSIM